MKLLVVASDRMEFAGLLARAGAPSHARTVQLGGHEMLLAANGVGAPRAAAAVDAALSWQPDALVSIGFCGALDAKLGIADIVVAQRVLASGRSYGSTGGDATIASVDHVVRTAAEKRALAASGAIAVEMEAAGVAERAEALHLPFYCIKSVSDLAGEDMANDFNKALTADGHFATITLLQGALARPFTRIPELLRLRKRCIRAALALGDFFADCRF
jgi:adenosylhomocysteine nucleosidase